MREGGFRQRDRRRRIVSGVQSPRALGVKVFVVAAVVVVGDIGMVAFVRHSDLLRAYSVEPTAWAVSGREREKLLIGELGELGVVIRNVLRSGATRPGDP